MDKKYSENVLKKHPQLEDTSVAIEEYKKTGSQTAECSSCKSLIQVREDNEKGILETNCSCGKCKTRLRWDPDQ